VVVIGLGNILVGDDGVGVEVARRLSKEKLPEGVKVVDGGTAVHEALYEAEGCDKLIIVDSVHGGQGPGAVYRVTPEELRRKSAQGGVGFSLHELSALPAIGLEELAGRSFGEVVIFGIEPKEMEFRMGLSAELEEKIPAILKLVLDEIGRRE